MERKGKTVKEESRMRRKGKKKGKDKKSMRKRRETCRIIDV